MKLAWPRLATSRWVIGNRVGVIGLLRSKKIHRAGLPLR